MPDTILEYAESKRSAITAAIDANGKGLKGQFMTPAVIAKTMAEMFPIEESHTIRLLDPGAGAGALTSAFLDRLAKERFHGKRVEVVVFELDRKLAQELKIIAAKASCIAVEEGWEFDFSIREADFIKEAALAFGNPLLQSDLVSRPFTHVIANPPYRKLSSRSEHRRILEAVGIRANNLYSAFIALSIKLLGEGGHLVAITPRSFCNGPYFRPFRQQLLSNCRFEQIHVFESRQSAFQEDAVLQENIIFHVQKERLKHNVTISSSTDREFQNSSLRKVPASRVVNPDDPDLIIHIPANDFDENVLERMGVFKKRLSSLGLQVSTGPVVDFRLRPHIHDEYKEGMVPLVYPSHFERNSVRWPKSRGRKPNAIEDREETSKWLMPNGNYVLTRRFSSKEEKRRIYPALLTNLDEYGDVIGLENHLNVIHCHGRGVDLELAKGLTAYLASSIVDLFFRQFSGHTQVNAGDIRMLPFPDKEFLLTLALSHDGMKVDRSLTDRQLEEYFSTKNGILSADPVKQANIN
jgi:adenine-specific DNA-methyltransferase